MWKLPSLNPWVFTFFSQSPSHAIKIKKGSSWAAAWHNTDKEEVGGKLLWKQRSLNLDNAVCQYQMGIAGSGMVTFVSPGWALFKLTWISTAVLCKPEFKENQSICLFTIKCSGVYSGNSEAGQLAKNHICSMSLEGKLHMVNWSAIPSLTLTLWRQVTLYIVRYWC